MKEVKMIVMEIGNSPNIPLSREVIENSLHTFINAPIVATDGKFRDYTDESNINTMVENCACGFIKSVKIVGDNVVADCLFRNEKYIKDMYDNWCIYDMIRDGNSFSFGHVEVYI